MIDREVWLPILTAALGQVGGLLIAWQTFRMQRNEARDLRQRAVIQELQEAIDKLWETDWQRMPVKWDKWFGIKPELFDPTRDGHQSPAGSRLELSNRASRLASYVEG